MKYAVLIFLLIFSTALLAQKPRPSGTPPKKNATIKPGSKGTPPRKPVAAAKSKPVVTPTPLSEKEQFEKASAYELAAQRVTALEEFLAAFPQSENRVAAAELLASSRVLIAEEKLLAGDGEGAAALFKLVVEQVPQPISNELFSEAIGKIPTTLFFRGQRAAALSIATIIENKIETNPTQLIEIANFYLSTENGADAMRVAAKAAARQPNSAAVHRTIALAHRINFDLDLSADSYAKALELEPDSVVAKRGLADMKRALGKSEEAIALYRELIQKNEKDLAAQTGLALALFDAGKKAEAEAELTRQLEKTPGNVLLAAGAAYWYASKGFGDKAVELAQKAIAKEPRYIWSHIALGRGLISQGKPVEAEQALIKARAYGNFPTIEYEIASARAAAGFFREAAEDLKKQFSVAGDRVKTNLGGRVSREEKSLAELVASERKASILAPVAADTAENAEILRALLVLENKLQTAEPNEAELVAAVDSFTAGVDKMKLHRQIYAASALLQKRAALGKVIELTRAATGNTDIGLEVANPRSAIMASELYEARADAFRRNEYLVVPDVPKQTLSAIVRGRIEEIAGWALYQQNSLPEAIVRLRRAVSVMPDKSAWWRSSMWRLGAALAAEGKDAEALNSYIESYKTDKPDYAKYLVVEALYRKVNGSVDGLETKIGTNRVIAAAPAIPDAQPVATPTPTVEAPAPTDGSTNNTVSTEPLTSTPASTETVAEKKPDPEVKKVDPPAEKPSPATTEPVVKTDSVTTEPAKPVPSDLGKETVTPVTTEVKKTDTTGTQPINTETKPTADPQPTPADEKPAADTSKAGVNKPLFEPIVITIPNNRPPKTAPVKKNGSEEKPSGKETASGELPATGDARVRVIDAQEVKTDEPAPCVISVSQKNLSLINGGGSVGILVGVEAPGEAKDLTATSSSPKDVDVILEPEISGLPNQRFYIIKSISTALGVYQVAFATPCGKTNVIVTIR